MPRAKATPASVSTTELATALKEAIESTKAIPKKTILTRTKRTPWTPPDGVAKVKLRRKMYQHGIQIDPERITNEIATLLNRVKPGIYLGGHVTVTKRRNGGINITYPVKTNAQRLKLPSVYGIRRFPELLERLITEAANPKLQDSADYD